MDLRRQCTYSMCEQSLLLLCKVQIYKETKTVGVIEYTQISQC